MSQLHTRIALLAAVALLAPSQCLERAIAAEPEQAMPQGEDPPGADNGAISPGTERDGVITPPDIGDEEIHTEVPNPEAGHEKEVIPPPDTGETPPPATEDAPKVTPR